MLQQADLEACLDAVHAIASAGPGVDDFARAGVANLKRLVGAEHTTLSIMLRREKKTTRGAVAKTSAARRPVAVPDSARPIRNVAAIVARAPIAIATRSIATDTPKI